MKILSFILLITVSNIQATQDSTRYSNTAHNNMIVGQAKTQRQPLNQANTKIYADAKTVSDKMQETKVDAILLEVIPDKDPHKPIGITIVVALLLMLIFTAIAPTPTEGAVIGIVLMFMVIVVCGYINNHIAIQNIAQAARRGSVKKALTTTEAGDMNTLLSTKERYMLISKGVEGIAPETADNTSDKTLKLIRMPQPREWKKIKPNAQ